MTMKLQGADFLSEQMKGFGPTVSQLAAKRGVAKAAQLVRKEMWKRMPKRRTGTLKRSIGYKTYGRKNGTVKSAYVGLRKQRGESKGRWYYRTLEFPHERGEAYNPFFQDAWDASKKPAAQLMIDATTAAIYTEATKVYKRSLRDQSRYGFRQGRRR